MCWVNDRDLVVIEDSNKLVKFRLDAAMEVCTRQSITELTFFAKDISCTEGQVYIVHNYVTPAQITIFDTEDGGEYKWVVRRIDSGLAPMISMNGWFVVLSNHPKSYVYTRDRLFVGTIDNTKWTYVSPIVYLTTSDYFWYYGERATNTFLQLTNVASMKTTSFRLPAATNVKSLTGTSDGNVMASLLLIDLSDRFAVYNSTGTLLHYLRIEVSSLSVVSANQWQSQRELMAFKPPSSRHEPILIYVGAATDSATVVKPWLGLSFMFGYIMILSYK